MMKITLWLRICGDTTTPATPSSTRIINSLCLVFSIDHIICFQIEVPPTQQIGYAHDDRMMWNLSVHYWPSLSGIWTRCWTNSRIAGDLRSHDAPETSQWFSSERVYISPKPHSVCKTATILFRPQGTKVYGVQPLLKVSSRSINVIKAMDIPYVFGKVWQCPRPLRKDLFWLEQ